MKHKVLKVEVQTESKEFHFRRLQFPPTAAPQIKSRGESTRSKSSAKSLGTFRLLLRPKNPHRKKKESWRLTERSKIVVKRFTLPASVLLVTQVEWRWIENFKSYSLKLRCQFFKYLTCQLNSTNEKGHRVLNSLEVFIHSIILHLNPRWWR